MCIQNNLQMILFHLRVGKQSTLDILNEVSPSLSTSWVTAEASIRQWIIDARYMYSDMHHHCAHVYVCRCRKPHNACFA